MKRNILLPLIPMILVIPMILASALLVIGSAFAPGQTDTVLAGMHPQIDEGIILKITGPEGEAPAIDGFPGERVPTRLVAQNTRNMAALQLEVRYDHQFLTIPEDGLLPGNLPDGFMFLHHADNERGTLKIALVSDLAAGLDSLTVAEIELEIVEVSSHPLELELTGLIAGDAAAPTRRIPVSSPVDSYISVQSPLETRTRHPEPSTDPAESASGETHQAGPSSELEVSVPTPEGMSRAVPTIVPAAPMFIAGAMSPDLLEVEAPTTPAASRGSRAHNPLVRLFQALWGVILTAVFAVIALGVVWRTRRRHSRNVLRS